MEQGFSSASSNEQLVITSTSRLRCLPTVSICVRVDVSKLCVSMFTTQEDGFNLK